MEGVILFTAEWCTMYMLSCYRIRPATWRICRGMQMQCAFGVEFLIIMDSDQPTRCKTTAVGRCVGDVILGTRNGICYRCCQWTTRCTYRIADYSVRRCCGILCKAPTGCRRNLTCDCVGQDIGMSMFIVQTGHSTKIYAVILPRKTPRCVPVACSTSSKGIKKEYCYQCYKS